VDAGWHVDPTGRHQLRYFNGTTWTGDVADDGRRGIDLLAPGGAASWAGGPERHDGGTGGSGIALAGLVLGVVGIAGALSIVLYPVAAACAILALVFGLVARRRARDAGRPLGGTVIAGIVLGIVGLVLAVAAAVLYLTVVEDLIGDLERRASVADYDLTRPTCELSAGRARYEAVLTNRREDTERFTVVIEFVDAATGDRRASGRAVIDDVLAGESVPISVSAPVEGESVLCRIDAVRIGQSPFG